MNEELEKALGELLSKANGGIDAASGFLVAELPGVIQQLLMWHGIYNFMMFLIGFTFLICIKKSIGKCGVIWDKAKQDYDNGKSWTRYSDSSAITSSNYDMVFLIYFVVPVQFTVGLCLINVEWLQIYIAPKVWLLEYAANLTK